MEERHAQELEEREVVDMEESDPIKDSQMGVIQESQAQKQGEESTEPPLNKRKKAKEEKDQEKVQLKREEHKALLKRAKALLQKNQSTSTAVWEGESTSTTAEVHPGPSIAREETDPQETSLVEAGPSLISLNPFEGEDEPVIRPTSGG